MNDYFGARFCTSGFGRFLSPDRADETEPVPYARLNDSHCLNHYACVGNNPESVFDSDGHAQQANAQGTK